jgi:hypothetical protein
MGCTVQTASLPKAEEKKRPYFSSRAGGFIPCAVMAWQLLLDPLAMLFLYPFRRPMASRLSESFPSS